MEILRPNCIGVDEVGLGCIAGPVCAGATIISQKAAEILVNAGVRDSKQISKDKHARFSRLIKKHADCWAVSSASVAEIDSLNVQQASFLAMRRAIAKLTMPEKALVFVDGNQPIPQLEWEQVTVIKGDNRFLQIAAASILAKEYRDRYMRKLAKKYPHYEWEKNAGYFGGKSKDQSTHIQGIIAHGFSPEHRQSYKNKWSLI